MQNLLQSVIVCGILFFNIMRVAYHQLYAHLSKRTVFAKRATKYVELALRQAKTKTGVFKPIHGQVRCPELVFSGAPVPRFSLSSDFNDLSKKKLSKYIISYLTSTNRTLGVFALFWRRTFD